MVQHIRDGGPMVDTDRKLILRELLQAYGIKTIQDLTTTMGMSPQQGWSLWHGYAQLGLKQARRFSETLGIPLMELLSLDPTPPTPPTRPRKEP